MSVVDYKKEGRIAVITMNRPEAMNTINPELIQGLNEAMTDFKDNEDLWLAILTGAGERAFCAGADVKSTGLTSSMESNTTSSNKGTTLIRADKIYKPFIAAINGYALGGGLELALTCDIRVAADHARMGQAEVNIGIMPLFGATQRLPRLIPWAKAAEMMFTGEYIDAQEAYRLGLVNKVVPLEQLMPTAMQMAELICQKGPLGVRAIKEAMIRGSNMPIDEGLELENKLSSQVRASEDAKEGIKAFIEKRKPEWKAK
jgi:enoyl-CoA hydratase/carnithine racemase